MMKTLVTGVSGFIGARLVADLPADGARVKALVQQARSEEAARLWPQGRLVLVTGDLTDPGSLGTPAIMWVLSSISPATRTRRLRTIARRPGTEGSRWKERATCSPRRLAGGVLEQLAIGGELLQFLWVGGLPENWSLFGISEP